MKSKSIDNTEEDRNDDLRGDNASLAEPPSSRRDFTRKAATGAAAVAMLANRPAWGNFSAECVSANAWASLSGNYSMTPGRFEEELAFRDELQQRALDDPENFEYVEDETQACLVPKSGNGAGDPP